ncbi:hypothetical protein EXIGLDRAFT_696777 [Exidia glandulosa HHB12029]|uniref:Uncharacterized protein n=1 Tax=Exidia glandulosa HHB12029 TaxID=1314781 RepID=A0A166A4J9_EXIGL|nr:hypothetical protein EXIGLDRAFT_696777 [Exidia glandulosa HHB12029]
MYEASGGTFWALRSLPAGRRYALHFAKITATQGPCYALRGNKELTYKWLTPSSKSRSLQLYFSLRMLLESPSPQPTSELDLNAISFAGEAELYHNQGGEDVDCDTGAVWAAAESYRQNVLAVITAYGANARCSALVPSALQSSLRDSVERVVEAELGPILQQLEDKIDGIPPTVQAAIDNAVEKAMNPVLRQLHELRVGQICLTETAP